MNTLPFPVDRKEITCLADVLSWGRDQITEQERGDLRLLCDKVRYLQTMIGQERRDLIGLIRVSLSEADLLMKLLHLSTEVMLQDQRRTLPLVQLSAKVITIATIFEQERGA